MIRRKNKDDIAAVRVNDYYTKTPTDALQAYYVIWSDIYGPMGSRTHTLCKTGRCIEISKRT